MSVYPDIITEVPGSIPFNWAPKQAVLKTEFASGREARRLVWKSPRRDINITYNALTYDQVNILWDFYAAMNGAYKAFSFYFPRIRPYPREFVGTSTGSEAIISLPCKDIVLTSFFSLMRGTYTLSYGSDYVFAGAPGSDGQLLANIYNTGTVGENYFFTFTGRLRILARFDDSSPTFRDTKDIASTVSSNLVGLQHELE